MAVKELHSIAVIGIGTWGKNLIREFSKIAKIPLCYNKANLENQNWLNENYPNIKGTHDYNEVLENNVIEAVIIATPINTHFELACKALNAGKHVFLEKPIANNVEDARELIKLSRNNKRILFVGNVFLYDENFSLIRKIVEKEEVRYAKFTWNKYGTFKEDIFMNLLIHDVGIASEIFGDPVSASVQGRGFLTKSDILSVKMEYENNRMCHIDINRLSRTKSKTITFITDHNLYIWENNSLLKYKDGGICSINEANISPLEVECNAFIDALHNQADTAKNINLSLNALILVDKLREACA